jgi:hypothetical protein
MRCPSPSSPRTSRFAGGGSSAKRAQQQLFPPSVGHRPEHLGEDPTEPLLLLASAPVLQVLPSFGSDPSQPFGASIHLYEPDQLLPADTQPHAQVRAQTALGTMRARGSPANTIGSVSSARSEQRSSRSASTNCHHQLGHRQAVPDEAGANLLGRSSPSAWKQRREDQSLSSVAEAVDKPGRTASAATDPPRQSVQVAVLAQSSQHRLRSASPTDLGPFSEVQSSQLVGTGMAQSPNISQHRKVTFDGSATGARRRLTTNHPIRRPAPVPSATSRPAHPKKGRQSTAVLGARTQSPQWEATPGSAQGREDRRERPGGAGSRKQRAGGRRAPKSENLPTYTALNQAAHDRPPSSLPGMVPKLPKASALGPPAAVVDRPLSSLPAPPDPSTNSRSRRSVSRRSTPTRRRLALSTEQANAGRRSAAPFVPRRSRWPGCPTPGRRRPRRRASQ